MGVACEELRGEVHAQGQVPFQASVSELKCK